MSDNDVTPTPRDRELSGVCFKNHNKRADRHPDWIGKATIQGTAYEVGLWEKSSLRNGEPILSMAFRDMPLNRPTKKQVVDQLMEMVGNYYEAIYAYRNLLRDGEYSDELWYKSKLKNAWEHAYEGMLALYHATEENVTKF